MHQRRINYWNRLLKITKEKKELKLVVKAGKAKFKRAVYRTHTERKAYYQGRAKLILKEDLRVSNSTVNHWLISLSKNIVLDRFKLSNFNRVLLDSKPRTSKIYNPRTELNLF